jgi:hypothetical protein
MTKKGWDRPQLTMVIRGNAEENVLISCKESFTGIGLDALNNGCYITGTCQQCYDYSAS